MSGRDGFFAATTSTRALHNPLVRGTDTGVVVLLSFNNPGIQYGPLAHACPFATSVQYDLIFMMASQFL
jgi:hypothetical protein